MSYIVNYYDFSSGEERLILSQEYENDIEHSTINLPVYEGQIPEGYSVNPSGWVLSKKGSIRTDFTMYTEEDINIKLTQYTSFINLDSVVGSQEINLYFGLYPIQYLITYRKFLQKSSSNYKTDTEYRVYGTEHQLKNLPITVPIDNTQTREVSVGYKLTNRMISQNSKEDQSIINEWFTSSENMNPGDEKISIVPANIASNVEVYSYEVPIDYKIFFHIMDFDNTELLKEEKETQYNTSVTFPAKPEELQGRVFFGWYSPEKDISTWYISTTSNSSIINGTTSVQKAPGVNTSNLTSEDKKELHYFGYYIPKAYTVSYEWLDEWSKNSIEYKLPSQATRIFGRDTYEIEIIPNYNDYIIDNVDTYNWYWFENNSLENERQTNQDNIISPYLSENKIFYALKTPKDRHIIFNSNDENLGTGQVVNPTENNGYLEGSTIEIYALPSENGAFLEWGDGDTNPKKVITFGSKNIVQDIVFRNEEKETGILKAYLGTTEMKAMCMGTKSCYKEAPPPSYTIPTYTFSNISTTYKFTYNSSTGYYVSGNKGKNSSWSLCRIDINCPTGGVMYVDCISYGENNFDFGILSNLNQTLSNSSSVDSTYKKSFKGLSSSSVQTVSYELPEGSCYITIKYRKDSSVNNGNDTLQFKIRMEIE